MLSNLMAFPAVLAMILLGQILANTNSGNTGAYNGFVPPLIGDSNQQAVQALIGIAMILTIPKTIEILQQILKAPKNSWGNAWSEAISGGTKLAGAGRDVGTAPLRMKVNNDARDLQGRQEAWLKNPAPAGPKPQAQGLLKRAQQIGYKPT